MSVTKAAEMMVERLALATVAERNAAYGKAIATLAPNDWYSERTQAYKDIFRELKRQGHNAWAVLAADIDAEVQS